MTQANGRELAWQAIGMTENQAPDRKKKAADRKARQAEELRANLMRRKAQTRSRRTGEADTRPEGLAKEAGADVEGSSE